MSDISSVTTKVTSGDPPTTVETIKPVILPPRPDKRSFIGALFSSDDGRADSIVMACLAALAVDAVFQGWQMAVGGAALFNPINFGGSVATIIGASGVAKGARDYMKPDHDGDGH
jgi:hypothetical protein